MSISVLSGERSNHIVSEARSWLGTPFKHQGRVKGVGCDCIGLIAGVARALKLPSRQGGWLHEYDRCDYPREPGGMQLQEMLERHLVSVKDHVSPSLRAKRSNLRQSNTAGDCFGISSLAITRVIHPANILLFRIEQQPQHVALMSRDTHMIHAYAPASKVVEVRLDSYWHERLVAVFRFAGGDYTQLLSRGGL